MTLVVEPLIEALNRNTEAFESLKEVLRTQFMASNYKKAKAKEDEPTPPEPRPEPAADTTDYQALSAAILKLAKAKGTPTALSVLKEFGVENASKLAQEQYAAVLSRVTDELADA